MRDDGRDNCLACLATVERGPLLDEDSHDLCPGSCEHTIREMQCSPTGTGDYDCTAWTTPASAP